MSKIWCIIWRFQPLHSGHSLLIETSIRENDATYVIIGSSNKHNIHNPYSAEFRKSLISQNFPKNSIHIWVLADFPNDIQWKDALLLQIPKNIKVVTLYCWDTQNDSAVQSLVSLENTLPFTLIVREIPRSIIPVSASEIREWIMKKNIKKIQKYLSPTTIQLLDL